MSVGTSSNSTNGQASAAIGANLTTYENVVGQVVVGKNNVAVQDAVFVVGNGAQSSTKNNALVIKQNGSINANGSKFAFGTGVTNSSGSDVNQFICGTYNTSDSDALFVVGNGTSSTTSNAFVVKKSGDAVCTGGLYSTNKVDAPLVNCTNCRASSVSSSEINASDDVNIVDTNGNVEFSVRDFREAVDKYTLSMNLPIGDRDISDPFTNADLELCEYLAGLIGGHQYTPSELYSLYLNGAVVRMNITRDNGHMLSFILNDAGPLGTNGQLTFMFSKINLSSVSTITLISNSAQTHYTQEIYTNNQIS